jgi:hypothetical protein
MSLTQGDEVFAGVHEDALNDIIHAFFNARPRYRAYGSPGLVPATTVAVTQMPALPLPGGGSVDWLVGFEIPEIDLFDQDKPLPPGVVLGAGQFSLSTKITICIICGGRKDNRSVDGHVQGRPLCTQLGVFAIGHLESWHNANGDGEVWLRVDQVELVDITPDSLESLLECLIREMLDNALSQIRLPLPAIRAGAFKLIVTRGPEIDDDRIKAFGDV